MLPHHRSDSASRTRKASALQNDSDPNRKRKRSRRPYALVCAVLAATVWTIFIFVWASHYLATEQDASTPVVDHPVRVYELWPDDYESTDFLETLKECNSIDAKEHHCLEYIPEGTTTQRIGVLRPPGALGFVFERFVEKVVSIHGTNETDLKLIPTSHVPPYGYGKTHGLTKIIRFAAMPLSLAAADVMRSFPQVDDTYTVSDLEQAVRQLVRWHCRLSHVAAHTRLLTLTLETIMEDPWQMEYKVKDFLGLGPATGNALDHVLEDKHIDEDELLTSLDLIVGHVSALLTKIDHVEKPKEKIDDILKGVLSDEMSSTRNLKDWPCLSFWSAGPKSNRSTNLDAVNRKIAEALSPNCTAEYSQCTVPRDRCEARGQAICNNKR